MLCHVCIKDRPESEMATGEKCQACADAWECMADLDKYVCTMLTATAGPTTVEIAPADVVRCIACGKARNAAKRPGLTRSKHVSFNDAQANILGVIGEFAAARELGVEMDWTVTRRGDGGKDLTLPDGRSSAVKFNHRYGGYVMVEARKEDTPERLADLTADTIIGTHGFCDPPACECRRIFSGREPVEVVIPGWLETGEFMEKHHTRDLGLGLRHIVTVDQLRPIEELRRPD